MIPPNRWYPLVNIQKAIENGHRNSGFSHKKMVIFHSYVSLSEGNFIGELSTICSWWYAPTFLSRSPECQHFLLLLPRHVCWLSPTMVDFIPLVIPIVGDYPQIYETWQWKIHRLVRWFSQLEHHLHRTFNCHFWLPECISLLNPDGIMYIYMYI